MSGGQLALAFISGGLGFAIADFVDRYLATYDPSAATPPTDRFTGGTNGTLANTLNVASSPSLVRIGAGIGVTLVPAVGAWMVRNDTGRAAFQGMMIGAGIKLFSTLWNTFVIGNLLKPAGTDQTSMKSSLGARLYPAEIVAQQNLATSPVPYTAPTGLNAPPRGAPAQLPARQGVGDPGPFATAPAPQHAPAGLGAPPAAAPQQQASAPAVAVSPYWNIGG